MRNCQQQFSICFQLAVSRREVAITSVRLLGVLGALYAFLFGLDLMGMAFKVDGVFGGFNGGLMVV